MLPNLFNNSLTLILGFITIILALLYLREYYTNKKNTQRQRKIWQEAREKSATLYQATEDAQKRIIAEGKLETAKLTSDFEDKLQKLLDTSSEAITSAQNQLTQYMEDLQKQSNATEEANQRTTQERINQLFERLEERLTEFLVKTEQSTTSSIELELTSTRQLIETYKTQQLKLIDENIIAMMEQTLNIVLGKKLSLQDQLDLVYEALEKARVEKFVV